MIVGRGMILYHGSNVEVSEPQIIISNRNLDFGTGSYTTSSFEQAKNGQKLTDQYAFLTVRGLRQFIIFER